MWTLQSQIPYPGGFPLSRESSVIPAQHLWARTDLLRQRNFMSLSQSTDGAPLPWWIKNPRGMLITWDGGRANSSAQASDSAWWLWLSSLIAFPTCGSPHPSPGIAQSQCPGHSSHSPQLPSHLHLAYCFIWLLAVWPFIKRCLMNPNKSPLSAVQLRILSVPFPHRPPTPSLCTKAGITSKPSPVLLRIVFLVCLL